MTGPPPGYRAPARAQEQAPAGAARVVLVGTPGPLRSAVARYLRSRATSVACLDAPGHLTHAFGPGGGRRRTPRSARSGAARGPAGEVGGLPGVRLEGAAVVFVAVPRPPGLALRLRHRYRPGALRAGFEQAALVARHRGAARVVAVSTVFCSGGEPKPAAGVGGPGAPGWPGDLGGPGEPSAEIAAAASAERGAHRFAGLGGDAVILRLGWAYGAEDGLTRRVLAAAGRGWRLIDGDPGDWLSMIAESDAARAVLPALSVPPGRYDVTDGCPVTQAAVNASLAAAAGIDLYPLDDPHWGRRGILFGRSRRVTGRAFGDLTGWQPEVTRAPEQLARMLVRPARR